MCGILGSFNHKFTSEKLQFIAHRGPDNEGWFEDERVEFGHTRLSIQDTSDRANQPFLSDDGNVILIFNGEIYNHWEIREKLKAPAEAYRSTADTETILRGYQELGEEIFYLFNGIFALAIYDKTAEKVILARDRFGVKPLYYTQQNGSLQFSSELKALEPPSMEVDAESLANYLRFLWSPGESTPFSKVKKLLPGKILVLDYSQGVEITQKRFFNPDFNGSTASLSEEEAIDQCEKLLLQAVERQLLSDVPVGFFLSGGIDSSLLVAMAAKIQKGKRLQCFTIDTAEFASQEGFSNDLDYAKIVAEALDVDLEIVPAQADIVNDFDKMIWHLDEPQADPAPLNVLNICKRAREMGFKVLVGGAGGDDVFSGYRRHQALGIQKMLRKIPYPVLNIIGSAEKLIKPTSANLRRAKKLLMSFKNRSDEMMFDLFCWLSEPKLLDLFNEPYRQQISESDKFAYFRQVLNQIPDEDRPLNKLLQLEMSTFLVDHNFNYTDKMGMAVGVEIRVPFLDNDLVDFSYSLSPEFKMKGKTAKYILKKVAERYLPHEVVYRSKAGFGAPVRKWVREDLDALIREELSRKKLNEGGIFNADAVWQLIEDNKDGKIDASYPIWSLLAIDSWMRQFKPLSTVKA